MATTSQKIIDIKFFVVILCAFTLDPIIEVPVINIPHAAPIIENPMQKIIPKFAKKKGDVFSNKV